MEAMIRRLAVLAVLTMMMPLAAQAAAVDEARIHFRRGTDLYDEGNFRAALIEFQQAYELSPNFKILYNIGQVHLQLQDYAQALRVFNRYLTEGGDDVAVVRREEVSREIVKLRSRVGQITIETVAEAEVLVDDESVGHAPLPGPISVSIGRHKVTVVPPGKPALNRQVDVAGLQSLTVVLGSDGGASSAPVTRSAPSSSSSSSSSRASPVVSAADLKSGRSPAMIPLWVVTGVLAVGAASFGVVALTASQSLVKLRGQLGTTKAELDAQAGKVSTFSLVSDILTVATVGAGIAALIFTLTGGSDGGGSVALGVGPTGVTVSGGF